jgi:hypothetical protein
MPLLSVTRAEAALVWKRTVPPGKVAFTVADWVLLYMA